MAEEQAGFVGWKVGQKPNLAAILVGNFCCCFLGIWNFHLYLEEMEKVLGVSSKMHWVKVILLAYGMLELDKELSKLEGKLNINVPEGALTISLIVCFPCLYILLPFKLMALLERANAIKAAQTSAEA